MFHRLALCSKTLSRLTHTGGRHRVLSGLTKCFVISFSFYSIRRLTNTAHSISTVATVECETIQVHEGNTTIPYSILESISGLFYSICRVITISILFTPPVLLLPMKYFSQSEDAWWRLVLLCFQLAGPTFVKFGQWMSTRRDVFSEKFCDTLSVLHSSVWTHSWEYTELALVAMLGEEWENQIVSISHSPIGSGGVAQVHKGYFYSATEKRAIAVAIKVLHPEIRYDIYTDLNVLGRLAWIVELIPLLKWISPLDSVKEFRSVLLDQIDLTLEARNLDTFNRNFRNVKNVSFPRPIWPLVTEEVLIETFHDGPSVADYLKHEDTELRKKIAVIGVNSLLKMLFTDNFVHVDLHPGNVLVNNNNRDEDLSIVILDAGLAKELTSKDFDNLVSLFRLVVTGKGREVASIFLERSKVQECRNEEKFRQEMGEFISHIHAQKLSLRRFQVSYILRQLFSMAVRHHVKIESNFATIMLAIMIAEGLGRTLDPDIDILKSAIPYLLTDLLANR